MVRCARCLRDWEWDERGDRWREVPTSTRAGHASGSLDRCPVCLFALSRARHVEYEAWVAAGRPQA